MLRITRPDLTASDEPVLLGPVPVANGRTNGTSAAGRPPTAAGPSGRQPQPAAGGGPLRKVLP